MTRNCSRKKFVRMPDKMDRIVIDSTGCPAMDVLDLAEDVLDGNVTHRQIISKLLHINALIVEKRTNS